MTSGLNLYGIMLATVFSEPFQMVFEVDHENRVATVFVRRV